jgi:hypothetical protein
MVAARSPVKSATTDSARKAWKATSLLPPFMLKQPHWPGAALERA